MSLAAIAITAIAAGTGVQAYSSYKQGRVAEEQAEAQAAWQRYNAKVAEIEAQTAKQEAALERQRAVQESLQHRKEARALKGRQRALYGASGVRFEGSPLLVAEDTASQLELENQLLYSQGVRRAAAISRQATRYAQKSILDTSMAGWSEKVAPTYARQGIYSAAGQTLSGLGMMGMMAYQPSAPTSPAGQTQPLNYSLSRRGAMGNWGSAMPKGF